MTGDRFSVVIFFLSINSLHDEVEMGYFVARYVMCLLIFVLGLQAPGLMSLRDFLDSDTARLHDMVC